MYKKLNQLILISVVYLLLASSFAIAADRPAYALDPDNLPTLLVGYELVADSETYLKVEASETYAAVYVSPAECYPVTAESPPCTSMLAFSYTLLLDETIVESQDAAYFETLNSTYAILYGSQGFEDVTDDVPGAVFAFLITFVLGEGSGYSGFSYVGNQTGLFFSITESAIATTPSRGIDDTDGQLGILAREDVLNALIVSTESATVGLEAELGSDDASFSSVVVITSSLMISALVIRRRRN